MAEEVSPPVSVDAAKTIEDSTRSTDAVAQPAVAEAKPAEGGVVATSGVAEVPATDATQEEAPADEDATADAQADTTAASDGADVAPAAEEPATNGTPAAKKATNGKHKSGASITEHKKKTPAKSKKKAPELRLNVSPGEMYMVAMRGYQPWPVIVCDEEMTPESLLSKRPVSAMRIDGTYRADFLEGGKNAKDRRYPVMFLGTNEFAWQVNTELLPFDLDEVKKDVESGNQPKKTKALLLAYETAAEGHDLEYFKKMLDQHDKATQEEQTKFEQAQLEKETKKKVKAEKASKRKSTAAEESDDVEMGDAGDVVAPSAKKAKATKKRKKDDESDGENDKPAKTPKTKLKLTNGKTPKDASAAKPKKEARGKKSSEEAESAAPEDPPMTDEERLAKREKQVLYLRHRLQKGLLPKDREPQYEDMSNMSDYLKQLESHDDLEAEIIKKTKVHKVLRNIIKLGFIPREEEYNFKQRSNDLLGKWGNALTADNDGPATAPSAEPVTNGAKGEEGDKQSVAKEDVLVGKTEEDKKGAAKVEAPADATPKKTTDGEGDIAMSDADKEIIKEAPAAQAEAEPSAEAAELETTTTTSDAATA